MKKIVILLVLLIVISWVFTQIFLPNMVAAKIAANEYKAYITCRTIQATCDTYKNEYGAYPESLMVLSSGVRPLLTKDLTRGETCGYHFYYEITEIGFILRAVPVKINYTGRYIFQTDEIGNLTISDKNGDCISIDDNWRPVMPSMPYPYKVGDSCIE